MNEQQQEPIEAELLQKRTKYQGFIAVDINRSQINQAPYNPRSIKPAQRARLKRTLQKNKLVDTVVWNRQTGNLVGGHQRLSILDDLEDGKDYSLTVQMVDVPEPKKRF